jgi:energy-coupling factor transporter transmembrane protein EcfT
MNQSKFSLADVLNVLASIAFGFVCFLGANFLNIDNDRVWGMPPTIGCVAMAVVYSALLFTTAFGAKLLKRTSHNFKTSFVLEVILLILFGLFAVFFASKYSPFPHFFTVTAQQSEIKSKLKTSIMQAENMFEEYESYADRRKTQYKATLKSVVKRPIDPTKFRDFGFKDIGAPSYDKQIDFKISTMHSDLFPPNYSDTTAKNGIKEVAINWLQYAENITRSWKPIGIVSVVNDIEKNSTNWQETLITLSQALEQGEQPPEFKYTPPSFDDVKPHFTELKSPTPPSIGFALIAYLLMLLAWFVTKRSGKGREAFTTKPYEVVL